MYCCADCFADLELKKLVNNNADIVGHCDFCGSDDARLLDLNQDNLLREFFPYVLELFKPEDLLTDYPAEQLDYLINFFKHKFEVFNPELDDGRCARLLQGICGPLNQDFLAAKVGIAVLSNKDFVKHNNLIKGHTWQDFAEEIKFSRRFHSHMLDTAVLKDILPFLTERYEKGTVFYRARISPDKQGFAAENMGAPPAHLAQGGRVNPHGISVLYLSDLPDTAFHEVRASAYDLVCVGTFRLRQNIQVVNLSAISSLGFILTHGSDNAAQYLRQYVLNIDHLKDIAHEIARPLRHNNVLDYVPGQYICDFIHAQNYDGIQYESVLTGKDKHALNIALFDQRLCECLKTEMFDMQNVDYGRAIKLQ